MVLRDWALELQGLGCPDDDGNEDPQTTKLVTDFLGNSDRFQFDRVTDLVLINYISFHQLQKEPMCIGLECDFQCLCIANSLTSCCTAQFVKYKIDSHLSIPLVMT